MAPRYPVIGYFSVIFFDKCTKHSLSYCEVLCVWVDERENAVGVNINLPLSSHSETTQPVKTGTGSSYQLIWILLALFRKGSRFINKLSCSKMQIPLY